MEFIDIKSFIEEKRDILLFILSVIAFIFIFQSPFLHSFIYSLRDWGYFGSFIAGLFFSFGLTILPATAILIILSESLNPFVIAFIAAIGAAASDFFMFTIMRKKVVARIKDVEKSKWFIKFEKLKRFKMLSFLLPFTGALLIAFPVPDEVGIALLGFSRMNSRVFLIVAFCAKFFGIIAIAGIAKLF